MLCRLERREHTRIVDKRKINPATSEICINELSSVKEHHQSSVTICRSHAKGDLKSAEEDNNGLLSLDDSASDTTQTTVRDILREKHPDLLQFTRRRMKQPCLLSSV